MHRSAKALAKRRDTRLAPGTANRLDAATARVISEGKVRTYDMGGKNSTLEVAKAIADYASA